MSSCSTCRCPGSGDRGLPAAAGGRRPDAGADADRPGRDRRPGGRPRRRGRRLSGQPFALRELMARVRALPPPGGRQAGERTELEGLSLDLLAHEARRGDVRIELTRTEFSLLEVFLRHPRQVLTRSTIFEHVWGYDFGAASNTLGVYIGYLRRKTEEAGVRVSCTRSAASATSSGRRELPAADHPGGGDRGRGRRGDRVAPDLRAGPRPAARGDRQLPAQPRPGLRPPGPGRAAGRDEGRPAAWPGRRGRGDLRPAPARRPPLRGARGAELGAGRVPALHFGISVRPGEGVGFAQVVNDTGSAAELRQPGRPPGDRGDPGARPHGSGVGPDRGPGRRPARPHPTVGFAPGLAVGSPRPLGEVDSVLGRVRLVLILLTAGGIALAAVLGRFVAGAAVAPVRR